MSKQRNRLELSGQFLQCPLLLSIDTYEGCSHGCRYCFVNYQYERQTRGKPMPEAVHPASLTKWERALNGESIGNPMVEYLVRKKHPIQLGTKADPFPVGIERELQITRKFIRLCNDSGYPAYICTKNTDPEEMPVDLLARGNYVLGVSLASHKAKQIRMLERAGSAPGVRIRRIPKGVFKKIIVKWQPFIPRLFDRSEIRRYLDAIAGTADGVSLSFLARSIVRDPELLEEIGPEELEELDEVELLVYIREQAHKRGLEFYTANYRALSDSPVCCGLRGDEFEMFTPWVWSYLVRKLFTGEKEYLTEKDVVDVFPDALKAVTFHTMNIALFSRWARYRSKRETILQEYIKNFTLDRKMNPVNFFAGLYSKVINGEFRIYFMDYRRLV
ncbi:MAG: hypothetical protein GY950_19255 [bacterium]|nr:hypothetical protein [bacterium]